jgi:Lhr-like helicase
MIRPGLSEIMERLATRAASAVVARSRLNVPALNAVLLRRLAAEPGHADSLLADPVFEAARVWEPSSLCLGDLEGDLLHPDLVAALDGAATERMPRDRKPFTHQHHAWRAARDGFSFLVTSGTGSGKTECFMVPMLDGLLRDPAKGRLAGVRAIIIYPLNALIESQRERLAAWTEALRHRVSFALYNGLTPETPRRVTRPLAGAELGDRRTIRDSPPAILVTNVTMLEYLLLRAQDRSILERSQGLLRWIVLDEAHSYIGAQAAEMALLLRRVRAAFGVAPDSVQLMATSATISEGPKTREKLAQFVADLAGQDGDRVRVIEGQERKVALPAEGVDTPLDPAGLAACEPGELWERLAPHPRVRRLLRAMEQGGVSLTEAGRHLFDAEGANRRAAIQAILDAAAVAGTAGTTGSRLLPWRAHLFHRALGGVWVCIDPACPHRDTELIEPESGWSLGAVWLRQRDRCLCGAPCFELVACDECGTPHLRAGLEAGAAARLVPARAGEIDEFAPDAEPDPESGLPVSRNEVLLRPSRGTTHDRFVQLDSGAVFDNAPPAGEQWTVLAVIDDETARTCCGGAGQAQVSPLRYGPAFFLGNALPLLLEALAPPIEKSGLPMGGRRAIGFSDSRQGAARLAAKLQQEAERTLTRAFLYHAAQEQRGPAGEERAKLEKKLAVYRCHPDDFPEEIRRVEAELDGAAQPVPWPDLVDRLGHQQELQEFAIQVWRERSRGGRQMAEHPEKLAEMFLYRELFRRPRVQNNPETMGLLRLAFPHLEAKARAKVPAQLVQAGVDEDGWIGLALAAIDFGFRDNLAVDISPDWMVRWVAPRGGRLRAICSPGLAPRDCPEGTTGHWPASKPHPGNPSRLRRLVYALIGGDWDSPTDQDRAGEVLSALWELITATAARHIGRGAYRLDFRKAGVARLGQAWLCPVTRRILAYSPAGRSPYDPARTLTQVHFPGLPVANAGGLDPKQRDDVRRWCAEAPEVAALRSQGLWTNLHDRAAEYPPFLRAQEHSAQIPRPVLEIYEDRFKDGFINVLNCTTTMEMGVDIPNVALVVNSNVPPSLSNYRQRVGRAGRRGEASAFAATFCRDLPWDLIAFEGPARYLATAISAPAVRLDSPSLVARHVHAALLGAFLRARPQGFSIRTSTGAFFGATEAADNPVAEDALVDAFITWLRDWQSHDQELFGHLDALTRGTALDGRSPVALAGATAEALEALLGHWRAEYGELLSRAAAATALEVKSAFTNRAKRMRGEFLLSELARRGFTPSYGFPVDVVCFDHLTGHDHDRDPADGPIAFGEPRGAPARTLDVAIREYAPGAEVLVDGLVHLSEGVLPAWSARADVSGLEDLQWFWECRQCHRFGLTRLVPEVCPTCEAPRPASHRTLRPSGFLGRRAPHTGYESLGHVPYQLPRIAATGAAWQALPDPQAGRLRADPVGQVVTLSSGANGFGYAVCLACGRAVAEEEEISHAATPMPDALRNHMPLASGREMKLVNGYCPGGLTEPHRVQRHVRLVHATRTDVLELQLPAGASGASGLALAAGLRETLAERLGADVREIGVAVSASQGPTGEARLSLFLHDRATQGAGLVTRLAEPDWFSGCLSHATERLDCVQDCENGCTACVLRPDLSFAGNQLDRRGGLDLARELHMRLKLPDALRVLGPETQILEEPLVDWLERQRRAGALAAVTVFLHGRPIEWDFPAWPLNGVLPRLKQAGVRARLVIDSTVLTDRTVEIAQRLDLYRLAGHAALAESASLPVASGAPILAVAERPTGPIAIAAPDPAGSVPGAAWGRGERIVLVRGPMPALPEMRDIESSRLVSLSLGNAWLLRLANHLDGPVAQFGRAFWNLIGRESPRILDAMKMHGVSLADYTDRYLVTPLSIRLFFEVLAAMPGRGERGQVSVTTARLDRYEQVGWAVYHSFAEDLPRRDVLQALLPKGASVIIRPRAELPHARRLRLILGDGRQVTLLLDQGFGAWRADGAPRHDFRSDAVQQARSLRGAVFGVRVERESEAPMIVQEEQASA